MGQANKERQMRAGWIDMLSMLTAFVARTPSWHRSLRGTGTRSDPRAPKRYDGEYLRLLRVKRGVGRPPHIVAARAAREARHA